MPSRCRTISFSPRRSSPSSPCRATAPSRSRWSRPRAPHRSFSTGASTSWSRGSSRDTEGAVAPFFSPDGKWGRLLPQRGDGEGADRRRAAGPSCGKQRPAPWGDMEHRRLHLLLRGQRCGIVAGIRERRPRRAGDQARRRSLRTDAPLARCPPRRKRPDLHQRHTGLDRVLRRRPHRGGAAGDRGTQDPGGRLQPGALPVERAPGVRARRRAPSQ